MNALAVKAFRDVSRERGRGALVVLAIAAGVAGFFGVLSAYAVLTRELNAGYLATNPASAVLLTDAVDDALVRAVLDGHGVAAAEPRRVVSARIRSGPGAWKSLVLFVVRDYRDIRVSRILPERGAWPPEAGEILIERDALGVARAAIGDSVTVLTSRGTSRSLRVSGSVHDVGQAQARMENAVYGYITLETLASLGEEPVLDRLNVLVAGNRFDEAHVRRVAEEVRGVAEKLGHPVRRVDVPEPGKHPHASIMGLLLLSMASFGLFVLLLSSVLVVNLVTGLMASETRAIGILKAVGGSRGRIARHYLAQAAVLGAAALLVGIPAGLLGGRALCRYLAVFLNFDVTKEAVPAWVFLLAGATGLAVPLLAAALPVWKATGASVRDALAYSGASLEAFGTGRFDRALARFGGAGRPLLFAIRNVFRRRARLALTLVTLTLAGVFFMAALGVRSSLVATLDRLFRARRYDLSVSTGMLAPVEKIGRAVAATPGITAWEGWITSEGTLPEGGESTPHPAASAGGPHAIGPQGGGLHGGGVSSDRFPVFALPSPSRMLEPEIVEGRGLAAGDVDALVVNTALAAKSPAMKVGNTVTFRMGPADTTWRVVGIAREPFSPPLAYVPLAFFESKGHTGVASALRLALVKTDAASVETVKAALEKNLEAEGLRASGALSNTEARYSFDQHMLMIYVFLVVMSAILGGVGALGLATTMSLNVLERRREIGVLRAIGATPAALRALLVIEGCAVAVLGWAIACVLAAPVVQHVGGGLVRAMFKGGLDAGFDARGPVIWLAVSLVTGAAASLVPAWRVSKRSVREALAWE